ncbi:MAG TPA: hypothetical protein VFU42_08725, partial [Candidatus Deferrimicrobiaceae bacterium]|nr:hypothetical protein [Candidatus Deferrimicrobiaceae bacterium]
PSHLDVRGFSYLSFWVRGERGGEAFRIKIADKAWAAREDGLTAGPVSEFLPGGVTKEWREVLIPLEIHSSLRREAMAFLTFDFDTPGRHTVYVDDISFKKNPGIPTPVTPKAPTPMAKRKDLPRAMWVWEPLPLLLKPARRADFFRFCKRERIGRVWLQIPIRIVRPPGTGGYALPSPGEEFDVEISHPAELRSFLSDAHGQGIRVEALDGAPEYAAKRYHRVVLAVVDAVIAFNRGSPPDDRFDGVHFDIEPYLLIGWHVRELREPILAEFLELNLECLRRIRSQSEMTYGIDIPFWWQSPDPETGEAIAAVAFRGARKAASFHLIDRLDFVGVMNYRNAADGADGMLAHGLELLESAEKSRKARLYMGVETITEPPIEVWFASGLPKRDFGKILSARAQDLLSESRINGFRMRVLDDGAHLHLGIEIPPGASPERKEAASGTIARIARILAPPDSDSTGSRTKEITQAALRKLSRDPEWRDPKLRDIPHPSGEESYPGFQATSVFLPKITFGSRSISDMRSELEAAEEEFRDYERYSGIAVHHYESYRRMVESSNR